MGLHPKMIPVVQSGLLSYPFVALEMPVCPAICFPLKSICSQDVALGFVMDTNGGC